MLDNTTRKKRIEDLKKRIVNTKENNSNNSIVKNYFSLRDYSDFTSLYYMPFYNLSFNVRLVYKAIKDWVLQWTYNVEDFIIIHNELWKKYKGNIENAEFFTPNETAKRLASKANNLAKWEKILDIWSWLGSILQYLNNWVWVEINKYYVEILENLFKLQVYQLDITTDKLQDKYKYICANPPFWTGLNDFVFKFIYENTTDDMQWFLLLPDDYDKLFAKFWFKILKKEKVKEKFVNTNIKTSIYFFEKDISRKNDILKIFKQEFKNTDIMQQKTSKNIINNSKPLKTLWDYLEEVDSYRWKWTIVVLLDSDNIIRKVTLIDITNTDKKLRKKYYRINNNVISPLFVGLLLRQFIGRKKQQAFQLNLRYIPDMEDVNYLYKIVRGLRSSIHIKFSNVSNKNSDILYKKLYINLVKIVFGTIPMEWVKKEFGILKNKIWLVNTLDEFYSLSNRL